MHILCLDARDAKMNKIIFSFGLVGEKGLQAKDYLLYNVRCVKMRVMQCKELRDHRDYGIARAIFVSEEKGCFKSSVWAGTYMVLGGRQGRKRCLKQRKQQMPGIDILKVR